MRGEEFSVEGCRRYLADRGYSVQGPDTRHVVPLGVQDPTEHSLCDGLVGVYSNGLHIGAIFLILGVSFLGTAIPIAGKFFPVLSRYPFVFVIAKTAATGVLLSVSTIHLIHEGAMAFREECMDETLKLYKPAYFLFALVAVLLMQLLDIQLGEIAERWLKAQSTADAAAAAEEASALADEGDAAEQPPQQPQERDGNFVELDAGLTGDAPDVDAAGCDAVVAPAKGVSDDSTPAEKPKRDDCPAALAVNEAPSCPYAHASEHRAESKDDDFAAHGHQHLAVRPPRDMNSIRRVIAAVCMEFGVTLHSVFVGLAVGLTTDAELRPLIVALVFHQMFEGMAMGSRLVDADFHAGLEVVLALVFSVSAPAGMAAATIAVSVSRDAMTGTGFVTLMGVLDSLCGGILLYLAFTLLLGDFVADLKHHCADGRPYRLWKKIGMFVALWIGMGLMALVGNWL
ncbi:putative mitochondrial iron/zinc transporter protein-like protein [Leptomonas pyrrhocoris]|uniref:Putative mitochondrial iron/zinc transporter protein-like protein n=1 Tax=Leptomonas pyrrhocoris TaxID=157538 RepID=A0A0M9FRM3_LEPPY|nr:putative mitochondrial iron/zinc transporter protein-like protein [Leptomonas pyrrhocoris]XP_015653020.1 putative mitochondrial iron/zinc transporter protein-like protein [Leptomonas pyrrhocoris]XP_015653030.1 putative mitochondrial iron/zinc transporter protein-like protein [Leptomonas pyrrhocoris]XP_015653031.1 putative mitochondrial iron/zinc transporter protein-like protein [Leptomonas pyrrhocoris]XP_015653032.1 putative mitochondrial iron/zinc transporter protein-like protein [Leptomona|eukprot:XP_015653019.1 putative mitochondrial iron/zinc transporter protein-like protein [Leptomonas pyrrhocoris]